MATLIEKITTRVFDEKQKNFFNIIRGTFKISKQQIAEPKKKRIKTKHRTYQKRFRRRSSTREENLEHIESHTQEMYRYHIDPAFIRDKLSDLEEKI